MDSLRMALIKLHGPPGWRAVGLRELARHLGRREGAVSLRACVAATAPFSAVTVLDPAVKVATQNIAMFPTALIEIPLPEGAGKGLFPLYKGLERNRVLPTLEAWLRDQTPDVVVLTEFWVKDEKKAFADQVSDLYPHWVAGPDEDSPRPVEVEVFDGGLLVLSRHPIIEWHQTVYRQCSGEDCFVNKGAIHLRVAIPGLPDGCDVFGTHMQSCPPEFGEGVIGAGPGDCGEKLRIYQTLHLRDFVHAYRDPTRPAFLLGDLNHDGNEPDEYAGLLAQLEAPMDLWAVAGSGPGITSDSVGSFQADRGPRPSSDLARHKDGSRLDFAFAWPGQDPPEPIAVLPASAEVLQLQTSAGRDLSDHYGLVASIAAVGTRAVEPTAAIGGVSLYARGLRCLRETGGPMPMLSEIGGNDEMRASITFTRATGGPPTTVKKAIDDMDTSDWGPFSAPLCIDAWPDPGSHIDVTAHVIEDDPSPIGSTGTVNMGERSIRLTRSELLLYKGRGQVPRTLPLFRGDGGEYALTIAVEVI